MYPCMIVVASAGDTEEGKDGEGEKEEELGGVRRS